MDREEVTEFLGQVPLLQCLPSSSIRRIADAVLVKHYEAGGYIAREGDPVDGLYIILDGQPVIIFACAGVARTSSVESDILIGPRKRCLSGPALELSRSSRSSCCTIFHQQRLMRRTFNISKLEIKDEAGKASTMAHTVCLLQDTDNSRCRSCQEARQSLHGGDV